MTVGAVVAVGLVLVTARAVVAGPPPSQLLTFRDHHDPDLVLTIEANPLAMQAGMFNMRVPGRGLYVSRSGAQLKANSPTSTVAQYKGDADLIVSTGTAVTRTPVAFSLQAQLDPAHHTAQATLTVGAEQFHLVQPAVGKGATNAVLAAFETALSANDWRGLYAIATTDITNTMSADAFVAQADAQRATVGTKTQLQRLSVGPRREHPDGRGRVVGRAPRSEHVSVRHLRSGWPLALPRAVRRRCDVYTHLRRHDGNPPGPLSAGAHHHRLPDRGRALAGRALDVPSRRR